MTTDRVADFVQSATAFCSFVESVPVTDIDDHRRSVDPPREMKRRVLKGTRNG